MQGCSCTARWALNFSHITCSKLVLLFTWLFLQLIIYISRTGNLFSHNVQILCTDNEFMLENMLAHKERGRREENTLHT